MPRLLKIPVAKLGSWFHETHGIVSFSGDDLRALEQNFRVNARGYEPYLKAGHNEKGPGLYDDEKAEAHLVDMRREGDVLFGLFEPHDQAIVDDIDQQKYRYASPELIRQAKDRQTGKPIAGPILRGVALTNTPSIPNLPRNSLVETDSLTQMLSDDLVVDSFAIRLTPANGATMSTTTEIPAAEANAPASTEAVPAPATEEFKGMLNSFIDKMKELLTPAEKAVEKTAEELEAEAQAVAAEAAKALAETEAAAKADAIEAELAAAREAAALAKAAQEAAEAKTAELEAAKAEAEAAKAEAEAAKEAADKAAAEADAARATAEAQKAEADAAAATATTEKAAAEAAAQEAAETAAAAEAARKEGEYTQMLSDRVAACVTAGIPPVEARRAKDLVLALRGSVTTLMLSDKEEPVNLEDAVFQLLSDRVGTIDFGQVGAVDPQAANANKTPGTPQLRGMSPGNPWANRLKASA